MPIKLKDKYCQHQSENDVLGSVSTPSFMASLNAPFEGLSYGETVEQSSPPRPQSLFGCFNSKNKMVCDDLSKNDRKYKRMMKNRESAARSRSRRQAYTSELEREIAELIEENAKLRKHQVELMLSAPTKIPKKNKHNRSMTAPF